MSDRVPYPASWSQAHRMELDEAFRRARNNGLWFFHGGLSGPLWFSPDELEAEQRAGKFLWSRENWQLRNPAEALAHIDRAMEALAKERADFEKRIKP